MPGHPTEPVSPPREDIRLHLERVLSSQHFRNSRRCQNMLRYVVEHTLDGHPDALKERIIGQAVFDRDAGYDTNQDAVVRNAAAEVRKRLAQYYQDAGPNGHEMRIELPSGTYVPEFHLPPLPVPEAAAATPVSPGVGWLTLVLALATVVAAAGWLVTARKGAQPAATELDQFWAPILAPPTPVQICVGQSRMNYLPVPLPEGQPDVAIPASKLVPMRDRFLWFGDSVCMADIAGYLSLHRKPFRFRGARVTPYAELRGNPIVLIGAFNNEWTIRLTEGLRFSLSNGDTPDVRGVRDREHGPGLTWHVARSPQGWISDEDYALVTRFFDPQTEQTVVAAGGITHFGTMAAGDFISNPAYFREALKSAPADWRRKNIQVVLQTKVSEGTPGPPRILAAYFW